MDMSGYVSIPVEHVRRGIDGRPVPPPLKVLDPVFFLHLPVRSDRSFQPEVEFLGGNSICKSNL